MTEQFYIAIDGGGTGTRVGLYDATGTLRAETTGAATNPFQVPVEEAAGRLAALARTLLEGRSSYSVVVGAGISGARDAADREKLANALCREIPNATRVLVTTDVHAHLVANAGREAAVLVIAGTGSSVAVLDANQECWLFGGRGPVLGDTGSAYHVAVTALRAAFAAKDKDAAAPELLSALVRAAGVTRDDDLVAWCAGAQKHEIAALAEPVVRSAEAADGTATWCLMDCARGLGQLVCDAIGRTLLGPAAPVYAMGGLFEQSVLYRDLFRRSLRALKIENDVKMAHLIGHRAVFAAARAQRLADSVPHAIATPESLVAAPDEVPIVHDAARIRLDFLNTDFLIDRMARADDEAASAAHACRQELALLINRVVTGFYNGGRLVYVGAGTSGRIGVLDASECPPTFGVPPEQVIGIIAGGDRALRDSVEGAEDDEDLGRADIEGIQPPVGKHDVVVGIAASGSTPYTLAAIAAAKAQGAAVALVCCNPDAKADVDHLLVLPTGPEVLPGSTRLKAGTATKMVLNMITTGAMALSGRVFEGYMIGVQPTNAKLRKRAAHIISVLTGLDDTRAAQRLAEAGNDVAAAVLMERLTVSAAEAHALLQKARGDMRVAIAWRQSGGGA